MIVQSIKKSCENKRCEALIELKYFNTLVTHGSEYNRMDRYTAQCPYCGKEQIWVIPRAEK